MSTRIEDLIARGDMRGAWQALRTQLESTDDRDTLLNLSRKLKRFPPGSGGEGWLIEKRLAFLNGYTSAWIASLFQMHLLRRGVWAHVWQSEYGLYEQAVLSRDESIVQFQPDVVYFFVGSEHVVVGSVEAEAARWTQLWKSTHELLHCEIVQNTFEEPAHRIFGNLEPAQKGSTGRFCRELNRQLIEAAPRFVHFNDVDFLASYYGRREWRDPSLYYVSKIPVASKNLGVYAENLAAIVGGLYGKSRKCLVLDLDNTLWGGVIGDDGVQGIVYGEDGGEGEAFKQFQLYLKQLKERGILLAVCSKNDETIAKEVFAKRSDFALRLADISCFVANWEPKSENIKKIAHELNLGLEALVFADDNPAERAEVRQALPGVAVVELPGDPSLYIRCLHETRLFETASVTAEDLSKAEHFNHEAKRRVLEDGSGSIPEYLRSLRMKAELRELDPLNVPRAAQLINKTNQFNFTTKRYTETQVEAFASNPEFLPLYVKLSDRFGDLGLISVLVARLGEPRTLHIDTWVMSCRVFKRDVEWMMMKRLVEKAREKGITHLYGSYLPTDRNAVVSGLFADMGFKPVDPDSPEQWCLDLQDETAVEKIRSREIFISE